jgi:DNA-binding PucR family transcriptional regulator
VDDEAAIEARALYDQGDRSLLAAILWDEGAPVADGRATSRLEAVADAMAREDPELIGDFMRRRLGGLAADDANTRRLRENVLVWLREGGSATRAAARLNTHRNTVLYRLQRVEEALGRSLGEDRLGLELALTLAERMGLGMLR